MNFYHHLAFMIARVGLDLAILFFVTGLLTSIFGWYRWQRSVPPRWLRLASLLPVVVALLLVALGAWQSWLIWSLLSQQDAISPTQTQLLVEQTAWSIVRCLGIGLIASAWLSWFSGGVNGILRRTRSRKGVPTTQQALDEVPSRGDWCLYIPLSLRALVSTHRICEVFRGEGFDFTLPRREGREERAGRGLALNGLPTSPLGLPQRDDD